AWHDAVRAGHVAAAHDGDVGLVRVRPEIALAHEVDRLLEIERRDLPSPSRLEDELGDAEELARSADDPDPREALEDVVLMVLRAASEDADHGIGMLTLERAKPAHLREHPVLRLLADRAGVVEDDAGVLDPIRDPIALVVERSQE